MREIESQAIAAQQQISLVRTQLGSKQREMRLAQLTRSEISSLPPDTAVYEGVGKMYDSLYPLPVYPLGHLAGLITPLAGSSPCPSRRSRISWARRSRKLRRRSRLWESGCTTSRRLQRTARSTSRRCSKGPVNDLNEGQDWTTGFVRLEWVPQIL